MTNLNIFFIFISSALICQCSLASGYNFGTQSISSMSTADASTVEAANAGTIYYNPAGLTKLDRPEIDVNFVFGHPSVYSENAQAFYPGNDAVRGQNASYIANGWKIIPHFYASYPINENITAGLGIYVPFGSETEYPENSTLRYTINKTLLRTIDINPTIAFKINPQHSVGIGLIAQHADAELRKFANFAPAPMYFGKADGIANLEADAWGYGFNVGWMWDVNDNARLGINYRSAIKHNLKGDARWDLVGPAFQMPGVTNIVRQKGYAENEKMSAKITTPESLSLQGMYRINPQFNLFGNVTWTRHSRFNELDIKFENPKQTLGGISNTSKIVPNWRDSWRVSIGGSYQVSEPLQLRAGLSWDQSPVKNPDYRLVTMPDNDRYWLSVGAKYDFNKNSTLNFGYSYMHVKDSKSNFKGCSGACVDSKISGSANFKADAHFVGVQYTHRF